MDNKTQRMRYGLLATIGLVLCILVIPKFAGLFHWNASDPGDSTPVLIANRYIPAFTVIKPELIRLQEFPKAFVPPGALHAKKDLQSENEQLLFTAAIAIPEGQPITRAIVTDASQNDTLGSLIRPGKVAVSFEADKAHGVGGWIRPGDTVALFAPGRKTRLLIRSVSVVAVDQQRLGQTSIKPADVSGEPGSILETPPVLEAKVLTIIVSPAEASAIIEAREAGPLNVVLRSLGDDLPWIPLK